MEQTGIQVKTGFFPMSWFLYMCTPVIEINGQKNITKWGSRFFALPPGKYLVKIYFPYFGMKECGANQIEVEVTENKSVFVDYYMSGWMMSKGKIKVVG
jgi:hypothetical protein